MDANKCILVVDDNTTNLKMIVEILKTRYTVCPAPSGERALDFLQSNKPDLILLDVEMPGMSGYDVLQSIKRDARLAEIPVLFLTALENSDMEERALSMGAVDYILKPVVAGVLLRRVQMHIELETYRKGLRALVDEKTQQLTKTKDAILDILANVTAFRDNETGAHILRTTEYARLIVEALQRQALPGRRPDDTYARNIIYSAKLHDIGKIAIADSILLKPDRLTGPEFERIKTHTTFGAMMIENAMNDIGDDSDFLTTAKEIVLTHHECWGGMGYPYGLSGEDIPLSGRIMAIADVYDALISKRPYKSAFSHENAVSIIQSEAGTHFDKVIVDACKDVFPRFLDIAQEFSDETNETEHKAW